MEPYSADRSLYGKLRRRLARLVTTKPARLNALARPLLTISFDDAPVSAAHEGAAILERHGVNGTYFISAGLSGSESHLGRYTDADDIRALHASGHEIACHTLTHLDYAPRLRPRQRRCDRRRTGREPRGAGGLRCPRPAYLRLSVR
jgi:peptidoglycan/xylan/chitin deacetylase (PgdA/CDA1 family)